MNRSVPTLNSTKKVIAWLRSFLPPHVVRREGNCVYFNRELNMREINRLIDRDHG